jgi:hypothetical protein
MEIESKDKVDEKCKRKLHNHDNDSDTDDEIKEEKILDVPKYQKDRVIGEKYLFNDRIVIWSGKRLFCEHDKEKDHCLLCSVDIYDCEKCDISFPNVSGYEEHLKSDKHLYTAKELKIIRRQQGIDAIEAGDDIEDYILSRLILNTDLKCVSIIGNTGNTFDIVFKFKDDELCHVLQSKKLSRVKDGPSYAIPLTAEYGDDTLIVGANIEDKVYYFIPFSKVKHLSKVSFSFSGNLGCYMYDNEEEFTRKLFAELRNTTKIREEDIPNYLSYEHKVEYYSMQRLDKICKSKELKYLRNRTNRNYIDGFINNRTIQCKAAGSKHRLLYQFTIVKTTASIPYDATDNIDFFIFNITVPQFEDNFYVVPKSVLQSRGYLTVGDQEGKDSIYIASPDYGYDHWTLKFLDKFDLLTEDQISPLLGKDPLEKVCIEKGFYYEKSKDSRGQLIISLIKNKRIRFISCSTEKTTSGIYEAGFRRKTNESERKLEKRKMRPYRESDEIDIFIVVMDEFLPNLCILPKSVLIEKGFVETATKKGATRLPMTFHFTESQRTTKSKAKSKNIYWLKNYWNNYSCF